jgi:nucleoside 2-deoxyribosyltransferase
MKKVYLAGGWFTPEQEAAHDIMVSSANNTKIPYYNPRNAGNFNGFNGKELFESNIEAIDECTALVASTSGKDMGTLFECGYAYSKGMPVIYFFTGQGKFNIMLAYSAAAIVTDEYQLTHALNEYNMYGTINNIQRFKGDME